MEKDKPLEPKKTSLQTIIDKLVESGRPATTANILAIARTTFKQAVSNRLKSPVVFTAEETTPPAEEATPPTEENPA